GGLALIQQALAQKLDVQTIKELVELKRQMDRDVAQRAFVDALSQFKAKPPKIFKDGEVDYTPQGKGRVHYRHATLANCCNILDSELSKVGLSFRWRTRTEGGIIWVTCILTHALGHSEETSLPSLPDQTGGKNPIQAVGSTVTYLQRYTLLTATGMAVQGQDDDGRAAGREDHEISKEEVQELADGLNATKSDWARFMDFFQIGDLNELKKSDLPKAREMLAKKRAQK